MATDRRKFLHITASALTITTASAGCLGESNGSGDDIPGELNNETEYLEVLEHEVFVEEWGSDDEEILAATVSLEFDDSWSFASDGIVAVLFEGYDQNDIVIDEDVVTYGMWTDDKERAELYLSDVGLDELERYEITVSTLYS